MSSRREWTQEEIDYLKTNIRRCTLDEIAAHLGRTRASVLLYNKRHLGIKQVKGTFTLSALCRALQVDHHTIDYWIQNGLLAEQERRRIRIGPHPVRTFDRKDVATFVQTYPFLVSRERLERAGNAPRILAFVQAEWDRDPWYGINQASQLCHMADGQLRKWLRRRRRGFQLNPRNRGKKWARWYIRRSEIAELVKDDRPRLPFGAGAGHYGPLTDDQVANLLVHLGIRSIRCLDCGFVYASEYAGQHRCDQSTAVAA